MKPNTLTNNGKTLTTRLLDDQEINFVSGGNPFWDDPFGSGDLPPPPPLSVPTMTNCPGLSICDDEYVYVLADRCLLSRVSAKYMAFAPVPVAHSAGTF